MDDDARFAELYALIEKERGRTEVLRGAVRALIRSQRQSPANLDTFLRVPVPDPTKISDNPKEKAFAEGVAEMINTLLWEIDAP